MSNSGMRQHPMPQGKTERERQLEFELEQAKAENLRHEVAKMNKEQEYWQQARIQTAIAALNGLTSNPSFEGHTLEDVIAECVTIADALIDELQKKGDENATKD